MNVLISYKGNIGEKTKKDHKLRPLKRLIIEPKETMHNFNTE